MLILLPITIHHVHAWIHVCIYLLCPKATQEVVGGRPGKCAEKNFAKFDAETVTLIGGDVNGFLLPNAQFS